MPGQLIKCGCGCSFPAPRSGSYTLKCPKCHKRIEYLSTDLALIPRSRDQDWETVLRRQPSRPAVRKRKPRVAQTQELVGNIRNMLTHYFIDSPLRLLALGVILALLAGTLFFTYQSQRLEVVPEYQKDYELAEELLARGRRKDAAKLFKDVIENSEANPRNIWVRRAKQHLAEMPVVP